MNILVMTAVEAEAAAIRRGISDNSRITVQIAGVGPSEAAARSAFALSNGQYDLVISAGIGGGFVGQAEIGAIAIASEIIAADLGAESADGFISVDQLGFGSARIPVHAEFADRAALRMRAAGLTVTVGPILTVSTVTGTEQTAAALAERIPKAAAEAMEGFGVATAAMLRGIPVLEFRAISNLVGPRDREAWRIKEALEALEAASSVLLEVL